MAHPRCPRLPRRAVLRRRGLLQLEHGLRDACGTVGGAPADPDGVRPLLRGLEERDLAARKAAVKAFEDALEVAPLEPPIRGEACAARAGQEPLFDGRTSGGLASGSEAFYSKRAPSFATFHAPRCSHVLASWCRGPGSSASVRRSGEGSHDAARSTRGLDPARRRGLRGRRPRLGGHPEVSLRLGTGRYRLHRPTIAGASSPPRAPWPSGAVRRRDRKRMAPRRDGAPPRAASDRRRLGGSAPRSRSPKPARGRRPEGAPPPAPPGMPGSGDPRRRSPSTPQVTARAL